jgi:hypothetical protein
LNQASGILSPMYGCWNVVSINFSNKADTPCKVNGVLYNDKQPGVSSLLSKYFVVYSINLTSAWVPRRYNCCHCFNDIQSLCRCHGRRPCSRSCHLNILCGYLVSCLAVIGWNLVWLSVSLHVLPSLVLGPPETNVGPVLEYLSFACHNHAQSDNS